MTEKANLLIIDDEVEVLKALTRLFRKHYKVHTTTDGNEALTLLEQHEIATVISDMRMPEMNGDKLLEQAFTIAPETPRLLLTGYSDMDSTSNAINLGRISNYISKPWDNAELLEIVAKTVDQYFTEQAAKSYKQDIEGQNKQLAARSQALSQKLNKDKSLLSKLNQQLQKKADSTRNLFHDVVDLISQISQQRVGDDQGHIKRVALHCRLLAKQLNLEPSQVSHCYLAGLMHEVGKVTLPDSLLNTCENNLNNQQIEAFKQHAEAGANLITNIAALNHVAEIVKHQYELVDGTGVPAHLTSEQIPVEVKILSVVNEYDKLLLGRITGNAMTPEQAQRHMAQHAHYDREVKDTYFRMLQQFEFDGQNDMDICIGTTQLQTGMTLSRDIDGNASTVLLTKGTELNDHHIEKLREYEKDWNTILNVFVV